MPKDTDSKKTVQYVISALREEIKKGRLELPAQPQIVQEIQSAVADPNSSLDTIASIVERDTAITARLIAAVNSPYYSRGKPTKTVRKSILLLGENETNHTVLAIANRSLFKTSRPEFNDLMEKLWRHSIATAYASKLIAEHLKNKNSEKIFLMGLLHDIGKTVIFRHLSKLPTTAYTFDTADIIQSTQQAHLSIGGVILRKWRFEKDFVRVATLHEGPKFFPPVAKAVLIVNLANALTRNIDCSLTQEEPVDLAALDSVHHLKLKADTLNQITEETGKIMSLIDL